MRQLVRVSVAVGFAVSMVGAALAEAPGASLRPMPRPVPVMSTVSPVVPVAPALADLQTDATGAIIVLRPRPRPAAVDVASSGRPANAGVAEAVTLSSPATQMEPGPALRPRPRPAAMAAAAAGSATAPDTAPEAVRQTAVSPAKKGLFSFLRPQKRPEEEQVQQVAAVRVLPGKEVAVSKKGSVCGIPDIKGEQLSPIASRIKGCGIDDPVRVTSVAGVQLSPPATINCETAKSLRTWLGKAVTPVYGKGKVVELKVAASYACRPRNNQRGAKVSEHGRGNAIDIAGLTFSNGKSVTVRSNYDKSLRKVHKAACGIFGTTLGPGSDGFHEDHLHFDVARYRGGPYCR